MIKIYTDGSCLKNPNGPGGWAVCILDDKVDFCLTGSNISTTNNRMELTALIEAISCVPTYKSCIIYTDSQLCINCATGKWKRKANIDLWELYDKISLNKVVKFEWVKGHSNNYYNDLVDKLAYDSAKSL